MADDPRTRVAAEWLRDDVNAELTDESAEWEQGVDMLTDLDAVDPLRALLGDEDRAVELFRSRGLTKNQAFRVLAALREVAGL